MHILLCLINFVAILTYIPQWQIKQSYLLHSIPWKDKRIINKYHVEYFGWLLN